MRTLTSLENLKTFAEKLEAQIELRFELFARDPKVLAVIAQGLNQASQLKLDIKMMHRECASLRARARTEALRLLSHRVRS